MLDVADCDDSDASTFPGANDSCDGIDNDCSGEVDEDLQVRYKDLDTDGYGGEALGEYQCDSIATFEDPTSWIPDDCDDANASVYPGATEVCVAVDENCDGTANDPSDSLGTTFSFYADQDHDGFGDEAAPLEQCSETPPEGYTTNSFDCDDTNASIHPSSTEDCTDGVDNDCSGVVDDNCS